MSQVQRLFIPTPPGWAEGLRVALDDAQARYLGTVMRRRPGDPVLAFNGHDGEWEGRIETLGKSGGQLVLASRTRAQRAETDLWLVFALLKRDATDLVVRMATELGVAAILPVLTARTVGGRVNEDRLHAIAVEAAEQCERLTVPRIETPRRLADILDAWPVDRPLFAALERSDAPLPRPAVGPAGLLVGPEGGFAPEEVRALKAHPLVRPIGLGPRVLRAETACLAGVALLQGPGCG